MELKIIKNKIIEILEYIVDSIMLLLNIIGFILIIPTTLSVFIVGFYLLFAITGSYLIPVYIGQIALYIAIIGFIIIGITDNYEFKKIGRKMT